jgi:hypothetical protein
MVQGASWSRGGRRIGILLALAAGATALLLATGARTDPAAAASCGTGSIDDASTPGALVLAGKDACGDASELFIVRCTGGTVRIIYAWLDTGTLSGEVDPETDCSSLQTISVSGALGNDVIDLASVTKASGFSSLTSITSSGGDGDDSLLLQNGVPDVADCGPGTDSAEADPATLDSLSNCETMDFLTATTAEPPPQPTPQPPPSTKKCKKRHKHGQKRRCKKKAA